MYDYYAEIDAFYWDELGCNYINDDGEVVPLYEKLDEETEKVIKDNTDFISINQPTEIKNFARKFLKKKKETEAIKKSLESFAELDCFYRNDSGIFFVTDKDIMCLTYSDSDKELLLYAKKYMPYLNNEKDIADFRKKCSEKHGWIVP